MEVVKLVDVEDLGAFKVHKMSRITTGLTWLDTEEACGSRISRTSDPSQRLTSAWRLCWSRPCQGGMELSCGHTPCNILQLYISLCSLQYFDHDSDWKTMQISQPDLVIEWSETQVICISLVTSWAGGPAAALMITDECASDSLHKRACITTVCRSIH